MEPTVMTASQQPLREIGQRVELARYTVQNEERIIYGQRIHGIVRVTDTPAARHGRSVLIERGLEQDGNDALRALVSDYVAQAVLHGQIPLLRDPIGPIFG
jgi:hypothetical protein